MTEGQPTPPYNDPSGLPPAPPPPPGGLPYSTGSTAGYPGPYVGPPPTKDDKTMALLAHLLGILLGFIGPLIIWLLKKDQSPFVDDQGKEALNFQIMLTIGYIVGSASIAICIGIALLPAVWIFGTIFSIIAAMKANEGVAYRYPVNLRLIK
jgi:uncharacterized protein